MEKAFSVTQINNYIKNMFEQDFVLANVTVKGEVSNLKYHTSGHIYFTLKDENGTISAVMFKGNTFNGLKFRMADGNQVVVKGSIKVYERDGKYELFARSITLSGEGDLFKQYQKLKDELEEMGMFAPEYKKPIKTFNRRVGIVTAKTGAAVQDIINISKRRNPYVELILYPAYVQGEEAKYSIVKGINTLDNMGLDVIIVGRGGGSIEDLWAFNEEMVARAIFQCNTPVISAVGHETDYTIADFVADLRAPTPSAAAELAVCDITAISERLSQYENSLKKLLLDNIAEKRNRIVTDNLKLSHLSPVSVLEEKRIFVDGMADRLNALIADIMKDRRMSLAVMAEKLNGMSPLLKLSQGYSIAVNENGDAVTSIFDVSKGSNISVNVADGIIDAQVRDIRKMEIG